MATELKTERFLNLRALSLLLVLIGLGISGYLAYVKAVDVQVICADGLSCEGVQNSIYGELWGMPVAYLGVVSYLAMGLLIWLEDRLEFLRENGMVILFGLVLFSWLYSMYLVYVQGVVLQAWCQWCLLHELNITILFLVTGWRLKTFLNEFDDEDFDID
jgi:uncharacterized membrane protein